MVSKPPTISLIAGARPNFMKVKPILDSLEGTGALVSLVHTGQHYDAVMSDIFFDDLGLRKPDHHLEVGSGLQGEQVGRILTAYEALVRDERPDAIVVVGDVNSTMACALVGAKEGILVAHVEAGLRSRDWAMPEEINRMVTDRVSDLLLTSSPDASDNLRSEGYREDQIHLVGNVMIDTLLANRERALARSTHDQLGVTKGEYGLVTLHRPSNVDDPIVLHGLIEALSNVADSLPLLFAVHPRTAQALEQMERSANLRLIGPQGYLDFLSLQAGARLVLTDSGGLQEETTALGVPCLTLRTSTERPITVDEGTNQMVGTDPDAIRAAASAVLENPPEPRCPALWDGHAGDRIADILLPAISDPTRLRPTDLAR